LATGEAHLAGGQRSSIAFMISSAHRTASATALTVAGTFFPPSNCLGIYAHSMSEDRLAAQDDMLAAMMTKSNAVN
jgi:hypothetical protein